MPSPIESAAAELEAKATSFVREHRLPGLAAGVVHGGELVWSGAPGFADVASRRSGDTGTLYRIASITKTFTATAIMQLRDEGRLHLDDPVVAHLPELRAAGSPFGAIETVTIRRLLSHESGLMGDPPGTDWSELVYEGDPAANLARAAEIATTVPPSTQQKYSNIGFQLLGETVARVSGTPYAQRVRETILDPLGLASTSFEPLAGELAARCATGYAARGFSDDLQRSPAMPAIEAEGGLWSCVGDLARWISAQFTEDVLPAATLAEMHRPRYLGDAAWTEAWGIGWYAVRRESGIWVQHSGGLPGFTSNVCFDPKEKIGAIVLVNGDSSPSGICMDLAEIGRRAVSAAPRPIEAPAPLPPEWGGLLGLYADPEYALLVRVEWRDGKLSLLAAGEDDWRPTLAPTQTADRFLVSPGVRESGEACVFHRRPDGRVASMMIATTSLRRLDPVDQG
jgi:CubicO group peptidase (beta-lactamase class C family)